MLPPQPPPPAPALGASQATFRVLLFVSACATVVLIDLTQTAHAGFLWTLLCVQLATLVNVVFVRSRAFQVWMHDFFVGMLVYAVLCDDDRALHAYGNVVAAVTLAARAWFGRCPFLWWHDSRNVAFDALGAGAWLVVHFLLPPPAAYRLPIAAVVGGASHFLQRADVVTKVRPESSLKKELDKCV